MDFITSKNLVIIASGITFLFGVYSLYFFPGSEDNHSEPTKAIIGMLKIIAYFLEAIFMLILVIVIMMSIS